MIVDDKLFFEKIFRDDIVVVVNRNYNDQINQMFGLKKRFWHFLPFLDRIGCFEEKKSPWNAFPTDKGLLYEYSFFEQFVNYLKTFSNEFSKVLFSKTLLHVIEIFTPKNFHSILKNYFEDEVFIFKENGNFSILEFDNQEDKKDFCEKSAHTFLFSNPKSPWSIFHCKEKFVKKDLFHAHYHPRKLVALRIIMSQVHKFIVDSQNDVISKFFFFLLRNEIKNQLQHKIGVIIDMKFNFTDLIFTNIILKPLSYDKESLMMSYMLKNTDLFVVNLFNNLKNNFLSHLSNLRAANEKIIWTSSYIDSVLQILFNSDILKKQIDISLYPEIVHILFPYQMITTPYKNIPQSGIVRSVINFKNLKKFAKYDEFFDDQKMKRILKITDQFMSSVTL